MGKAWYLIRVRLTHHNLHLYVFLIKFSRSLMIISRFIVFNFVPCAPPMRPPSPSPLFIYLDPLPFLQEALEVLVAQGLTVQVSGTLSGWIASFPSHPNVSYAGNRLIASVAWSKGLTCDTWYHFVGSTVPSLASSTWFPLTATTR